MNTIIELFANGAFAALSFALTAAIWLLPVWIFNLFAYLEKKGKTWVNSPYVIGAWFVLSICWIGGIASVLVGIGL